MTMGNVLYLLMVIGVFVVFAAVLAYQSWQQARLGPDMVSVPKMTSGTARDGHESTLEHRAQLHA